MTERERHGSQYPGVVLRSIVLFLATAVCEIGGVPALGVYGFVATLRPDAPFGRTLAAYGGVFVAVIMSGPRGG